MAAAGAEKSVTFAPKGELTIYTAAAITEQLGRILAEGRPLKLDLSAISECDTAGVQILLLLRKHLNTDLKVTKVSDAITDVLKLYGLEALVAK